MIFQDKNFRHVAGELRDMRRECNYFSEPSLRHPRMRYDIVGEGWRSISSPGQSKRERVMRAHQVGLLKISWRYPMI